MTRPNIQFPNLSALYLHKQAMCRPTPCRCHDNAEALVSVGVLVFLIGMVAGVLLCQTVGG